MIAPRSRSAVALAVAIGTVVVSTAIAGCRDRSPTTPPTTPPTTTTAPTAPTTTLPSLPPLVVTAEARAQAQRGELPPGPEVDVVMGKCAICHSTQYLTMQRLTPSQWEKTLKKMKGWGAPVDDVEVARLQRYLGAYFTPDLGDPVVVVVAPPAGAAP
jgi:hypothetical protein